MAYSKELVKAAQELLARVRLLAEQDRDDHGRFSGPGGGGGSGGSYKEHAHAADKATKAARKQDTSAAHTKAADAHKQALKSGENEGRKDAFREYHSSQIAYHERTAELRKK